MQKISDKARAHTNALLAYMMTAPTRDDLETWWSKRHPVRLELHRLLRDLADDGRLTKDGDTYRVPSQAPVPSPRKAPPPVRPVREALISLPDGARLVCVEPGVPPRVTVEMGSGRDTVKIIGAPARVTAMADAYQCQVAAEAKATPVTPTPLPVVHSVTLAVGGAVVNVVSTDKAAAQAVALAYQRAQVRRTAPLRPLAIGKAPLLPLPPPPPANAPARGTVAWRIWSLLKKRARTVGEVVAALSIPAPSARGRLSEMSAAGLVARRTDGAWEVKA